MSIKVLVHLTNLYYVVMGGFVGAIILAAFTVSSPPLLIVIVAPLGVTIGLSVTQADTISHMEER